MRLRFLDHALDFGLGEPARRLDSDRLLLAALLVLRRDVHNAVGVDVERHLDLWQAAGRRWNADKIELPEQLVVRRHFTLTLEDADGDGRLIEVTFDIDANGIVN